MAALSRTDPATSIRPAPRFGSRGRNTEASTSPAAPTGTASRKIQRQPSASASSPPQTLPTAAASPATAPQTAKARCCSRPRYDALMSGSVVANMAAPPTPCAPRNAMSSRTPGASPQASEASVKSANPARKTLRRPSASPTAPQTMRSAASASV